MTERVVSASATVRANGHVRYCIVIKDIETAHTWALTYEGDVDVQQLQDALMEWEEDQRLDFDEDFGDLFGKEVDDLGRRVREHSTLGERSRRFQS